MINYRYLSLLLVATLLIGIQTSEAFATQTSAGVIGSVVIIPRSITPSISINPTFGPGGTHATVTGSNFSPHQDIKLIFADSQGHSHVLASHVMVDSNGAFSVQVTIPNSASSGSATITVQHDSQTLASTTFNVTFSKITVYPTSGAGGTHVTVTGSGFGLNQGVDIFIGTDISHHLVHIGEVTTDGTGAFTKQVTIPSDISAGDYFISAREDSNRDVFAAAWFEVLPAPTTTAIFWSHNPSTFGQSVTFTARVLPAPDGGTVTFYDGSIPLGSDHVRDSGQATFSTSSLLIGTHYITAKYSGDPNFSSSTSSTLTQIVKQG
jgi:hypothetical protein